MIELQASKKSKIYKEMCSQPNKMSNFHILIQIVNSSCNQNQSLGFFYIKYAVAIQVELMILWSDIHCIKVNKVDQTYFLLYVNFD